MSFIDEIKINVIGGHGGSGNLLSFKRNLKNIHYGGRGGLGGDIYIQADNNINSFNTFKFKNIFKASNGKPGRNNLCTGKKGKDLLIKVPLYTKIYSLNRISLIANLSFNKQKILVARGGHYGLGNVSKDCNISNSYLGQAGERRHLLLRLILKNDVAIIGLPNTGKSTIFNKITNKISKVCSYPYSTNKPCLGRLKNDIYPEYSESIVTVLDMPNIIDYKVTKINNIYLKHLEYSRLLLFVVDINQTSNIHIYNLYIIFKYIKNILRKLDSIWLIFNKIDLILNKQFKKNYILKIMKNLEIKHKCFFIYNRSNQNINILIRDIYRFFS